MSVVNHSGRLPGAYAKAITETGSEGIDGAIARAQRRADSTGKNVVVYGRRPGRGKRKWEYGMDAQVTPSRRNPARSTKAQKKEKTRKASAKRRIATALAGYLKKMNPGKKIIGAKQQKLAGGAIKITPILAKGRKR